MKKNLLLLFAALFVAFSATAKPRTQAAIKSAATAAIKSMKAQGGSKFANTQEPKLLMHTAGLSIMGYDDCSFAVISNDDLMPAVLAVSDAPFSGNENPGLQWWLKAINEVAEVTVAKGAAPKTVPSPTSLGFPASVDEICKTTWDQEAPYWNKCPKQGNSRCLTGCVATAISQVLYTHRTPVYGKGSRTNTSAGSSSSAKVTFNYDGWTPDYDNMLESYSGSYTTAQADAVADLMLACGVAVNMDYSPSGSGAYTDQARDGLVQYMGIETANFKERDNYSDTEWMKMVYAELAGGHCMYYSAVDPTPWTGGGHAFVCDGYDANGKVHINWGWSGKDNGFYNIDLLNPVGYKFSDYQDFIMGLWDPNEGNDGFDLINKSVDVSEAGSLQSSIAETDAARLKYIKVTGPMNMTDVEFLRQLATGEQLDWLPLQDEASQNPKNAPAKAEGDDEVHPSQRGHLAQIDLSEAQLVNNTLGDDAFKDAKILRSIALPRQLDKIGSRAFKDCTGLEVLRSYTYDVPQMGTKVFEGVDPSALTVYLIAGSPTAYKRNAQWKTILTDDNTKEFGTCVKGGVKTVVYGSAVPTYSYTVAGQSVAGKPALTSEYTPESPVGTYVVTVSAGTITDLTDVVFVDGKVNVTKAALTITAVDATREEGKANPEFEVEYSGFKNEETSDVLLVQPTVTCEADESSPVGEYDIVVSGADAQNYKFTYVAGKLTVIPSTPTVIRSASTYAVSHDVYTLQGVLVRRANEASALRSGLYIIDGKKVMVK